MEQATPRKIVNAINNKVARIERLGDKYVCQPAGEDRLNNVKLSYDWGTVLATVKSGRIEICNKEKMNPATLVELGIALADLAESQQELIKSRLRGQK